MNKGKKAFMYIFLSIVSFLSVFPLYYMFCASTNKSVDVIAGKLIPGTYLIENFKTLIANQNLGLALWNSSETQRYLRFCVCWYVLLQGMDLKSIMIKEKILFLRFY